MRQIPPGSASGNGELERACGPIAFAPEWRALEPFARQGLCAIEPRRMTVLPRGRLFLRHLAMAFDAYLPRRPEGEPASDAPRFSQTV